MNKNLNWFLFMGIIGAFTVEVINKLYNHTAGIGVIVYLLATVLFYLNENYMNQKQ